MPQEGPRPRSSVCHISSEVPSIKERPAACRICQNKTHLFDVADAAPAGTQSPHAVLPAGDGCLHCSLDVQHVY